MITIKKGNTETIVLTLTEKQTLVNPNYLFVFKSRMPEQIVSFVLLNAADTSLYKYRYNQFSLVVNNYFSNSPHGEWRYYIYEQASATNKDETKTGGLLEEGIMRLNEAEAYSYVSYNVETEFITHG
jgi:hypothetical protein